MTASCGPACVRKGLGNQREGRQGGREPLLIVPKRNIDRTGPQIVRLWPRPILVNPWPVSGGTPIMAQGPVVKGGVEPDPSGFAGMPKNPKGVRIGVGIAARHTSAMWFLVDKNTEYSWIQKEANVVDQRLERSRRVGCRIDTKLEGMPV